MADKLNKSLDELIDSSPRSRGRGGKRGSRGSRGGGRGGRFNSQGGGAFRSSGRRGRSFNPYGRKEKEERDLSEPWTHDRFEGGAGETEAAPKQEQPKGEIKLYVPPGARSGAKNKQNKDKSNFKKGTAVNISNLSYEVIQDDLEELFGDVGNILKCKIHFDRTGRSLGTAKVVFEDKSAALKAIESFDGVVVEGKKLAIVLAEEEEKDDESHSKKAKPKNVITKGRGVNRKANDENKIKYDDEDLSSLSIRVKVNNNAGDEKPKGIRYL